MGGLVCTESRIQANLLYCIALIYKERAEGALAWILHARIVTVAESPACMVSNLRLIVPAGESETDQILTIFGRADKEGTGVVEMEALVRVSHTHTVELDHWVRIRGSIHV